MITVIYHVLLGSGASALLSAVPSVRFVLACCHSSPLTAFCSCRCDLCYIMDDVRLSVLQKAFDNTSKELVLAKLSEKKAQDYQSLLKVQLSVGRSDLKKALSFWNPPKSERAQLSPREWRHVFIEKGERCTKQIIALNSSLAAARKEVSSVRSVYDACTEDGAVRDALACSLQMAVAAVAERQESVLAQRVALQHAVAKGLTEQKIEDQLNSEVERCRNFVDQKSSQLPAALRSVSDARVRVRSLETQLANLQAGLAQIQGPGAIEADGSTVLPAASVLQDHSEGVADKALEDHQDEAVLMSTLAPASPTGAPGQQPESPVLTAVGSSSHGQDELDMSCHFETGDAKIQNSSVSEDGSSIGQPTPAPLQVEHEDPHCVDEQLQIQDVAGDMSGLQFQGEVEGPAIPADLSLSEACIEQAENNVGTADKTALQGRDHQEKLDASATVFSVEGCELHVETSTATADVAPSQVQASQLEIGTPANNDIRPDDALSISGSDHSNLDLDGYCPSSRHVCTPEPSSRQSPRTDGSLFSGDGDQSEQELVAQSSSLSPPKLALTRKADQLTSIDGCSDVLAPAPKARRRTRKAT